MSGIFDLVMPGDSQTKRRSGTKKGRKEYIGQGEEDEPLRGGSSRTVRANARTGCITGIIALILGLVLGVLVVVSLASSAKEEINAFIIRVPAPAGSAKRDAHLLQKTKLVNHPHDAEYTKGGVMKFNEISVRSFEISLDNEMGEDFHAFSKGDIMNNLKNMASNITVSKRVPSSRTLLKDAHMKKFSKSSSILKERSGKSKRFPITPNLAKAYSSVHVIETTASSINAALQKCSTHLNKVISCRILLEEGEYTESIHIGPTTGGMLENAGESNSFLGVEILGDTRPYISRSFVHGGFNAFLDRGGFFPELTPNSNFASGYPGAYVDLDFPDANTVSVNLVNNFGTTLPATISAGTRTINQMDFTNIGYVVGDRIRFHLPRTADGSCVETFGTYHDALVTGMTSSTISFSPALPGGIPTPLLDGTSFTILPNVVIKGDPSAAPEENQDPTLIVSGTSAIVQGIEFVASEAPSDPQSGPGTFVVFVSAGGSLKLVTSTVSDIDNQSVEAVIGVSSTSLITTGSGLQFYDEEIVTPPNTFAAISLKLTGRLPSVLTVFGGLSGLGQVTINGRFSSSAFYGIGAFDPINALEGSFVSIGAATVADSPGNCVFVANADVGIGRLACLRTSFSGSFVLGDSRAYIASTGLYRVRLLENGFNAGCLLATQSADVTIGTDPIFQGSSAVGVVGGSAGRPIECSIVSSCSGDRFAAFNAWHTSSVSINQAVAFSGWDNEYHAGTTAKIASQFAFGVTSSSTLGGDQNLIVSACLYPESRDFEAECSVNFFPETPTNYVDLTIEDKHLYANKRYSLYSKNTNTTTLTLSGGATWNCGAEDVATFDAIGDGITWLVNEDGTCWFVESNNGVTLSVAP